ncbi:cysteine proteinase [Ceratobasidium sp. AG-I]|nr:cysteine proteinase [Ceratobasidium sp. AG-I]
MEKLNIGSAQPSIPRYENGSTARERHNSIIIAKQMPLESGTIWYVVSRKWYQAWEAATLGVSDKEFADVTEATLGPVDNSNIVHPGTTEMLPLLAEGHDVEFVPQDAWNSLVQWYDQPSIVIGREVVSYPTASGLPETRIEVYPPTFWTFLLAHPKAESPIPNAKFSFSSLQSLSALASRAASCLALSETDEFRVWNMPSITPKKGVTVADVEFGTLIPISLDDKTPVTDFTRLGPVFAVEVQTNGQWLLDATSVSAPLVSSKSISTSEGDSELLPNVPFRGKPIGSFVPRGTMGLQNHGNTCFMDSALQCLLHIPELEKYFLQDLHQHELNPDNPLGMEGQLANAFNVLMHRMYPATAQPTTTEEAKSKTQPPRRVGSSSSYAPRDFKTTVCQFAPVFAGYEEGDSQELVGTVLDGLHEDLNRVLKKPYVEKPEWPEELDSGLSRAQLESRVAHETWEGHARRNDSIIADLFQGMYKSTVECPECAKVSVTFDPFLSLALPLPATGTEWQHTVYYVPWDLDKPTLSVEVALPKHSTTGLLKKKLAGWLDLDQEKLLAAEVWKHKFLKFFDDDANITELKLADTLVVYELSTTAFVPKTGSYTPPSAPSSIHANDLFIIPVLHSSSGSAFGLPFVSVVNPDEARSQGGLYRALAKQCTRWVDHEISTTNEHSSVNSANGPFDIHIFNSGSNGLETGFRFGSSTGRLVELTTRESSSTSGQSLIKPTEALVLNWRPEVKERFFPATHSSFDRWEPYAFSKTSDSHSKSRSKDTPTDLEDCLDELTKVEQLGANDSWYCSRCQKHQQASKQLQLWRLPNILVFQLKRFEKRGKIDDLITFPIYGLDLSSRVIEQGDGSVYDLFAVDEHEGDRVSTGHYTAYAINDSDGMWYHYQDAIVSPSTPQASVNPAAYLLFYRRRTPFTESVFNKVKLRTDLPTSSPKH